MWKVLVLVPFPLKDDALKLRRDQSTAVRLGPDIVFDYRPVSAGPAWYDSEHDLAFADLAMLEVGQSAQDEGYDAVCLDTMSDSGMNALRSVLDIPVIGAGQASYLMALQLGGRFSILQQWEPWLIAIKKKLTEYGLADKCVSMRSPNLVPDPENLLGGRESKVFPLLREHGMKCVEDGAEVIILGSTTMHQAHAFLAAELPVPVVNPGPLTYKLVETVLALGLTHSRRTYPRPRVAKSDLLRAMFEAAKAHERGR